MKIFWIMSSNLVMNYCMGLWLMGSRRLAAKAFSTNSLSTTPTTTRRMITPILTTTTTKVLRMSSTTDDSIDSYGRRIRRRPRPQEDVDDGWGDTSGGAGGWNDDNDGDDYRRQQRRRQRSSGGWDDDDNDDDGWGAPSSHSRQARDSGGWDDFDPFDDKPQRRGGRGQRSSPSRQREWRKDYSRNNHNKRHSRPSQRKFDGNQKKTDKSNRSINMNALEGAGFVHLYGLSSIVNALKADRRDLTTVHDRSENLFGDDNDNNEEPREAPKPQAQFRPYLFVQERKAAATNQRTGQKASTAEQVLELAKERDVPVAYVDKGVLNTLSGNRPHQGFVLRCGKLYFESLSRIPFPAEDGDDFSSPKLWLVLDEVVDPQNLGALLRSAYFLGNEKRVGVLVCSKNSAPPTPVVSAASAGALEVSTVYSTNNLPRTLATAKKDGFRIVGASSSVPTNHNVNNNEEEGPETPNLYDLQDLPTLAGDGDDRPILLVLGSEGHGLRTLVAKACTEFVRIPAGTTTTEGVDSLNVSVTGGILLWHLLNGKT